MLSLLSAIFPKSTPVTLFSVIPPDPTEATYPQ